MLTAASSGRLDPAVDAWLRGGAGLGEACEQVIETSISWVFLYRTRVLKLKKPVDMGFLDFTTPDKRRWAAMRELAFNHPTAPNIYRAVRGVAPDGEGGFCLDGPGEAIDWAVEMRRFPEDQVLRGCPETVTGDLAERLGRTIAKIHSRAAPGRLGGGAAGLGYVIGSNAVQLRALANELGAADVEALIAKTAAAATRAAPLLDQRLAGGLVRCCHGDLHLGNILLENGEVVLFDCLEFNDRLREIDIFYDLAFLLMDLGFRDNPAGANRVLNGWLDEAARTFGDAVWDGLAVLPLFTAIRATVRAHVCGHQGDFGEARQYLACARAALAPAAPCVVAIGGRSGSGKTTLARARAPSLPGPAGAVVLRSDEIRKRLWNHQPTQKLPADAYSLGANEQVYAAMFESARRCLAAGASVALDAAFLRPRERERAEALAAVAGVPFEGVWLEIDPDLMRRRIAARTHDASDADISVLEAQLGLDVGEISWSRPAAG